MLAGLLAARVGETNCPSPPASRVPASRTALLTRSRYRVEDELAEALGHDDLRTPIPKKPAFEDGGDPICHARNVLLRALIRAGIMKGGKLHDGQRTAAPHCENERLCNESHSPAIPPPPVFQNPVAIAPAIAMDLRKILQIWARRQIVVSWLAESGCQIQPTVAQ
jgi:hypothetical protein